MAVAAAGEGVEYLVASSDTNQFVTRPDSKDSPHGEVGVHNGGAIQGVKGHAEAFTCRNEGNTISQSISKKPMNDDIYMLLFTGAQAIVRLWQGVSVTPTCRTHLLYNVVRSSSYC